MCPSAALARPAGAVPGGGVPLGGTGSTCRSCPRRECAPRRHWLDLPELSPAGGVPPAALAIPAPGERTISNAEVPLPRSPLSLAAGTAHRKAVLSVLRRVGDSEGTPPPGAGLAGRASAARVQPRGCKGLRPLHMKSKNLPLPRRGRGQGGWGKEIKLKAGQAGGKEGKPPLRIPERQGQPAIKLASPPKITPAPAARGKQSQNRARQLHRTPRQKYEEEARCRRTGR